jgi:hypothetical protein
MMTDAEMISFAKACDYTQPNRIFTKHRLHVDVIENYYVITYPNGDVDVDNSGFIGEIFRRYVATNYIYKPMISFDLMTSRTTQLCAIKAIYELNKYKYATFIEISHYNKFIATDKLGIWALFYKRKLNVYIENPVYQ